MKLPEKVCEICDGFGSQQTGENSFRECACVYRRRLRAALGHEIACARTVFESPLYSPGVVPGDPPTVDLTGENLKIRGIWQDILSHFKWSLGCKLGDTQFHFTWRLETDERLRTVWVGSEAYGSRSRKKRDDMETFNNLSDLIGHCDLVVIRLGHLGYPNRAMPGILKEALMMREVAEKATWVVEELSKPFCQDHFAWDSDVAEHIDRNYRLLDLDPYKEAVTPVEKPLATPTLRANKPPPEPAEPDPLVDDGGDFDMLLSKPKSKWGGGGGKSKYGKQKGGGPLG